MEKQPLIILTGPTAVGKTGLSINLAKETGGEIISADSMQVYKYMDIGSAKIRPEEMQGVQHHLIDVLHPAQDFNVVIFQKMCKEAMQEIYAAKKLPIITGGTGFYIQSVLYDIDFTENEEDSAYRRDLELIAKEQGAEVLHARLAKVDPASAEAIHANNVKRVIRALEFYEQTGTKISEHNEEQHGKESAYNSAYFVLTQDRAVLYDCIEKRIDLMLEEGLLHEVKGLLAEGCKPESVSMQGLGYKEIVAYLNGECTLEEAIYILKRDTRHFAKRQLTWFKREREVLWFDKGAYENEDAILEAMLAEARKRGIV